MYPNEIDTFPTRLKGETVEADHMNAVQLGLTAVETVLGFNPAGTEATVAQRLASLTTNVALALPRKSPIDFGCQFDGVTDDSAALNAFFASLGPRDVVQFPSSQTAIISAPVLVGSQFTEGRILGNNSILKLAPGAASGTVVMNLEAPGIVVRDLRVDCSGITDSSGIRPKADDQQIKDCDFLVGPAGGIYVMGSAIGLEITGNRFVGAGYGVLFYTGATTAHVDISHNRFVGGVGGDAIEVNTPAGRAKYITVSNNHIRGYVGNPYSGIGIGIAHASNVTISDNVIDGSGLDGIHVEDSSNSVVITGNQVVGATGSAAGISVIDGVGVSGSTSLTSLISVHNNVVADCAAGGISVHGTGGASAANYSIIGNKVVGCGTAGSATLRNGITVGYGTSSTIVAHNHVMNTKGDALAAGIRIDSATALCVGNYVGDDQVTKTQKYGVLATGTAVVNERDNINTGNATGLLHATDTARFQSFDAGTDILGFGGVMGASGDNSAAFLAALTGAKNAASTVPFSLSPDPVGNRVITLPPGDFVITQPGGMLGQENMTGKVSGLRFIGAGEGLTRVIFKPATAGALLQNDYWLNLQFEGITFYAATAGCTFFASHTTHNAQRYRFDNCGFVNWKYGLELQGDNNNSEFFFNNCHNTGMEAAGAFLKIGSTNVSDQFLNYWFYGCTHWSTDAPFVDIAAGGNVSIYGLDASNWGSGLTATGGKLFNLRGTTHAQGVCNFQANTVRVEAKAAKAGLLYSEWPHGSVSLRGVDWSSQAPFVTFEDLVHIVYSNNLGPTYTVRDSTLAGKVRVAYGVNGWAHQHRITFEDCTWLQQVSPSDVVVYDGSGASPNAASMPPVEFVRCRSGADTSVLDTAGTAVWDATIGYRGDLLQSLRRRTVSIRAVNGLPSGTTKPNLRLPVGALITGFEAIAPPGGSGEGDGGSWTLATTDTSPVTVATATVTGAMSDGFSVSATLAQPFACDTTARATLTVTPTSVDQINGSGMLLVHGYW